MKYSYENVWGRKLRLRSLLGEVKRSILPGRNLWPEKMRVQAALKQYRAAQGYSFDIDKPLLFTEKIVWYKLFFDREDLVRVVDKYLFKDYVNGILGEGYTVPIIGTWENVRDLRRDWDTLPSSFCLKSTLMSDGRGVKLIRNKTEEAPEQILREVRAWLKPQNTLINSFCRAYYPAKPRILAETIISDYDKPLIEYKVMCFHGEPYCTYTVTDRVSVDDRNRDILRKDYAITFFDNSWNMLDVTLGGHRRALLEKPKQYEEMLRISRRLSRGFPFVRVDFLVNEEKIYVGEMTLYPSGGLLRYEPVSFNEELGKRLQLPE